jgi:adenosine deaminase
LRAQLHGLPKVDLHRHLEGSLRIQTLAEIAQEHGIDLPSYDIESLRPLVTVTDEQPDFHRFLEKSRLLRRFYPTQEPVERIAYEAAAAAAADNVRYLELRFNPIAQARMQGFPLEQVTAWVCNAVARAQRDFGVRVSLILQIGRDESLETASQMVDIALAYRDKGIVGLDLAGDEVRYPARGFAKVFQRARQEGLSITVHAGEAAGAQNVCEAIELLVAQRIGHGLRTVENSEIVRLVRDRGVTLELCPTSNLQTGAVRRLGQHPLTDLMTLGLRVTINTDDPSVSDTTLTDEYMVVMLTMGATLEQIKRTIVTAAEGAFLPPEEKEQLVAQFRRELGVT